MKVELSIVVFACDDHKAIERLLKEIRLLTKDLILIDCSEDKKRMEKIARVQNASYYWVVKLGLAEPYKQYIFSKAKNNWILQLDSDEGLSDELAKELPNLISANEADAYKIIRYENDEKTFHTWQTRLFDRRKALPPRGVHGHIGTSGRMLELRDKSLYLTHLSKFHKDRDYSKLMIFESPLRSITHSYAVTILRTGIQGLFDLPRISSAISRMSKPYDKKELGAIRKIIKREGVTKFLGLDKEKNVELLKRKYSNYTKKSSDLLIYLIFKKYREGKI